MNQFAFDSPSAAYCPSEHLRRGLAAHFVRFGGYGDLNGDEILNVADVQCPY